MIENFIKAAGLCILVFVIVVLVVGFSMQMCMHSSWCG